MAYFDLNKLNLA